MAAAIRVVNQSRCRFAAEPCHCQQGTPGRRVGISLGGGGSGKQFSRDQRCITEQNGGLIQSNLVASCSDDGTYINRATAIKILHNTPIDTGGISVRVVESSADVQGSLGGRPDSNSRWWFAACDRQL
jgi:hypothetical protein